MKRKLLCAVHDPGGAKVLAPVIAALAKSANFELTVYGSTYAAGWLEEFGIAFSPLDTRPDPSFVENVFSSIRPDALLSATSWGSSAEQLFRNQADRLALPSVVVIDYWANYRIRYENCSQPISEVRDWIAVVDEPMSAEVIAAGFPRERIMVVGHPHLDALYRLRERFGRKQKEKSSAPRVIFLSEPLSEDLVTALGRHPLLQLAEAFSDWLGERGYASADFHLKLHPKENSNPTLEKALQELYAVPRLKVSVLPQDTSLVHHFHEYDWAMGYQTMALYEAKVLGLQSLAIPLTKITPFPAWAAAMDAIGIVRIQPNRDSFVEGIRELGAGYGQPPTENPYSGAVDRVCALVKQVVGLS